MNYDKKELYITKRKSGVDLGPNISELWNAVRSDTDPTNYLLLKYMSGNDIIPCGCGEGGLDEMVSQLEDDDVYFGGIRCEVKGMMKFFSFSFVGKNVGGMKRGKSSLHKSEYAVSGP